MHPPLALIAHDPLLAVVGKVEVDLLAVQAEGLFLILLDAVRAEILDVVLVGLVVLGQFVRFAYLIAAHIRVAFPPLPPLPSLALALLGRGVLTLELFVVFVHFL